MQFPNQTDQEERKKQIIYIKNVKEDIAMESIVIKQIRNYYK